ncbi:hypothetical protein ASD54_10940 [Rhizobium sp. Root149]|nr:hypothetical protein ASD54_10940 [Rhizobium sp. Root149]
MGQEKDATVGINEIAQSLGCSTRTIRRYHKRGQIPTFKIGEGTSPIKMSRVDLKKLKRRKGAS